MSLHRIRLVGPWDFCWRATLGDAAPLVTQGTAQMPRDWQTLFGAVPGRAIFSRRFHRPSNLEPPERVSLVLSGVRGAGTASLNGELLGEFVSQGEAVEFDVTSRLQPF